jgi:hypothetical protein
LRSRFDRHIVTLVSTARALGNGSLGALIGGKANARERPLVSHCRDTLPKPSH